MNEEERSILEQFKEAVNVANDSKALKLGLEIGNNVLHNLLTKDKLRYLFKKERQKLTDFKDYQIHFLNFVIPKLRILYYKPNEYVSLIKKKYQRSKMQVQIMEMINCNKCKCELPKEDKNYKTLWFHVEEPHFKIITDDFIIHLCCDCMKLFKKWL